MKEYKVVAERGSRLRDQVDSEGLEAMLNKYATEGWRVVNSFAVFRFGRRSSIVTVMERGVS